MKYFQICLMLLFSFIKLSALEEDCPFKCNKYLAKSAYYSLKKLFQDAFPPKGQYELAGFSAYDGYCNYDVWPRTRKTWSSSKPTIYLDTERRGYTLWLNQDARLWDIVDLGDYLTCAGVIEDEIEIYIHHQNKAYSEALAWNEKAIAHFKKLQARGIYGCCGAFYEVKDSVIEKIKSEKSRHTSFLAKLEKIQLEAVRLRNLYQETHQDILKNYDNQLNECFEEHNWDGVYYSKGLLAFHFGKMSEAIDNMRAFLESLDEKSKKEISRRAVYNKGVIESEVGLYNEAILSLTQAIEKDPDFKEAYFERAIAYFETGQFDQSLQDYLKADRKFKSLEETDLADIKDFGAGLIKGGIQGVSESANEFLPSICNSVYGVGHFVWMTIQHPINTPKQLVVDTMNLCERLRICDKAELAQLLVPEMYELIVNWDALQYVRRGELMGYCLGKYGVDILLPLATVKGVKYLKAYRDIKNGEKLAVLQTLAASPHGKEALAQAGTKWKQSRIDYFAKIELSAANQGKHIRSAHNFIPTRSEWTHSNPGAKIKQLAGKGQKVAGKPGKPGFRERVDCGEVIGYFYEESSGNKTPTTMAIIHYGKKGAHIVPAKPKK